MRSDPAPRARPFAQVDVFTATPFRGNPVAVVLDAAGLDTEAMQRIARWTNLSETTFVLPPEDPGADYRVRIFTPASELPFAGHPTLGTALAVMQHGRAPRDGRLIQQCAAGCVPVRVTGPTAAADAASTGTHPAAEPWLSFLLPPVQQRPLAEATALALAQVLGQPLDALHPPMRLDVGPVWTVVQLPSADAVRALELDLARLAALADGSGVDGLVVFGAHAADRPAPKGAQYELRAFAPASGVAEDPVCGSGNGCVAHYLRVTGQQPGPAGGYRVTQGVRVGRDGVIAIQYEGDEIWVGGQVVSVVRGTLLA